MELFSFLFFFFLSSVVIYLKVTVLQYSLAINSLSVSSPALQRELRTCLAQAVRSGAACPGEVGRPESQNSSILLFTCLSMDSMPCAEPHIFLSTSQSHSLACSSSSLMLQRIRALDSSSMMGLQEVSSLMWNMTSWLKVPGQNTCETSPLLHASCAASFRPLSSISLADAPPIIVENMTVELVWTLSEAGIGRLEPRLFIGPDHITERQDGCS